MTLHTCDICLQTSCTGYPPTRTKPTKA
uniref:Uncharacterized protein n=1 Tax=Anguilla anguilla TaxID=7936 RepID=A0A0E9R669_ANGAN